MDERNCEVCDNYGPVYVCSSSIAAATFAYCETCVRLGREPYPVVVASRWSTDEDPYTNMDAYLRSLGKHRLDYENDLEAFDRVMVGILAAAPEISEEDYRG